MRRVLLFLALLMPAVVAFPISAQATSSANSQNAANLRPLEHFESHCVNVVTPHNWKGQICAIVNTNDAVAGNQQQALITFKVNSGHIFQIYGQGGLYLRKCNTQYQGCVNDHYVQDPHKQWLSSNPVSSFLSNPWTTHHDIGQEQARIQKPCIEWAGTAGTACYNGDLRSGWY